MLWTIELLVAVLVTFFFVKRERPNILFLFLGYLFFLVSLCIQIPVKYVMVNFKDYFQANVIPLYIITIVFIMISPVLKYFSLKKFVKTKSYKNGILFGIGWATLESINHFKVIFLSTMVSIFALEFDINLFLNPNLTFWHFIFYFIFNLAITVLIIISLIRRKSFYILLAVGLSLVFYFGDMYLIDSTQRILFYLFFSVYSLFTIFHYRKIKYL